MTDFARTLGSARSSPVCRTRVLVVEDDDLIRGLITSVLKREQMDVLEETRSDAAIEILEREQIGAVVLDLMILPRGGTAVLEWMESERPDLLARTVVVSAASPKQIEEATRGRPCRSIPKPFDIAELVSVVSGCAG